MFNLIIQLWWILAVGTLDLYLWYVGTIFPTKGQSWAPYIHSMET